MFLIKNINRVFRTYKTAIPQGRCFLNTGKPFVGIIVGMIATMLIHSSAATVALTISLFSVDLISFEVAVG